MNDIEQKKEKIKSVVSHIICENPILHEVVTDTVNRIQQKFVVKINDDKNSYGSRSNGEIILGLGNLEKLYKICVNFILLFQLDLCTDNRFFELISDIDLCIDIWDLKDSTIDSIVFVNKNEIDCVDILVINALAYTLYHEFGHVKYDKDSMSQVEKERTADYFTMEVLHETCSQEKSVRIEESPMFLGAFIENILLLLVSKSRDAEIAVSHPHPIERIYLFLEYFHIDDNSYLWRYAYDTIVKWADDNDLAMTFVKDSSKSIKDKMLDTYHRFKK